MRRIALQVPLGIDGLEDSAWRDDQVAQHKRNQVLVQRLVRLGVIAGLDVHDQCNHHLLTGLDAVKVQLRRQPRQVPRRLHGGLSAGQAGNLERVRLCSGKPGQGRQQGPDQTDQDPRSRVRALRHH